MKEEKINECLEELKKHNDKANIKDIPDILTCAGLLHDIGNPPFSILVKRL